MSIDYIPRADGDFDAWQINFLAYAASHASELGISLLDVGPAVDLGEQWHADYLRHIAARQAAQAATQTKNASRAALLALVRPLVIRIQASPQVDDAERAALGITVPDRSPAPTGAPATRPVVRIDFSERLRHVIRFSDEGMPTRRARPRGVLGAEVWVQVSPPGADPPADPAELTFLSLATRPPAVAEYTGDDAGKTAHYMLRWLSTRGEAGPWSETASATVGG